jgi:hypothetical protein
MYAMPEYFPRMGPAEALIKSITRKGLTTGLKLCLDAGDSGSYGGSGQTWADRSGGGVDHFLGRNSGVDANDPTFTGAAGDPSKNTYFALDGGDYFTANTGAAGYAAALAGWISNIHRDSAKFTLFCWFYPSARQLFCLLGTIGDQAAGDRGFLWWSSGASGTLSFALKHGFTGISSTGVYNANAWNCAALSVDESLGSNNALFFMNGTFDALGSVTYSGPDSGNATNILQVGATGGTGQSDVRALPNGSRFSCVSVWEGVALTQAQIWTLYKATKTRFK